MKLYCQRFDLAIEPRTKAGPEGWLQFLVKIQVPGFQGKFEAEMQLEDLERFKIDLRNMDDRIGEECDASLEGAEPGIYLKLKSNKLGQVYCEYEFESERYDGKPTCLSGSFEIDQTYIKPLMLSVSEDIKRIKV